MVTHMYGSILLRIRHSLQSQVSYPTMIYNISFKAEVLSDSVSETDPLYEQCLFSPLILLRMIDRYQRELCLGLTYTGIFL